MSVSVSENGGGEAGSASASGDCVTAQRSSRALGRAHGLGNHGHGHARHAPGANGHEAAASGHGAGAEANESAEAGEAQRRRARGRAAVCSDKRVRTGTRTLLRRRARRLRTRGDPSLEREFDEVGESMTVTVRMLGMSKAVRLEEVHKGDAGSAQYGDRRGSNAGIKSRCVSSTVTGLPSMRSRPRVAASAFSQSCL